MKLGEVDTLVDVYKLQPQRKGKDLLVEGQSVKEDLWVLSWWLVGQDVFDRFFFFLKKLNDRDRILFELGLY